MEGFFGSSAGLSASVITRLTTQWQDEHRSFSTRSLKGSDFVYVWVDGVHFNIWLAEDRLCVLAMVGVRLDGIKELVAIRDGYRESKESWADLLRDLKRRTRLSAHPLSPSSRDGQGDPRALSLPRVATSMSCRVTGVGDRTG